MTRSVPAGVVSDWQGATPKPIVLVDLATGKSPANVRMTQRGAAVTFAGVTFSPRRFELDRARVEGTAQASTLALRVDDTDGAFQTLRAAGADFVGQRVTVYRTNVGSTGGAGTDAMKDVYLIDSWERAGRAFAFTLKPLVAVFDVEIPIRIVTKEDFPGIPAESE